MALESKKVTIEKITEDVQHVVASLKDFKEEIGALTRGKIIVIVYYK